jgi:hypothetical protein
MKALTVCQPYATRIALGEKPIENRTWQSSFIGPLLIHAGISRQWLSDGDERRYPTMAFGAIVAQVEVVACLSWSLPNWPEPWACLHDHEDAEGPYCLILEHVRALPKPVPCRGALGFWTVPEAVERAVREQLEAVPAR